MKGFKDGKGDFRPTGNSSKGVSKDSMEKEQLMKEPSRSSLGLKKLKIWKAWDNLSESERFDLIDDKFHNSNLSNINDLSEKDYDDLPDKIQDKIRPSLVKIS